MILQLNGTEVEFSILSSSGRDWVDIRFLVTTDNIRFEKAGAYLTRNELEKFLSVTDFLLKGKIVRKYSLTWKKLGLRIVFVPNAEIGLMRPEEREHATCQMQFEIFTRNKDTGLWNATSVVVRLARVEIEKLLDGLLQEYTVAVGKPQEKDKFSYFHNKETEEQPLIAETGTAQSDDGAYLYVGVSPRGCVGCNYWYVDEEKRTQANTYVWVTMGRRNTEQIVYVDSVRYCNANDAPYPINKTKRVLRQTTQEETELADALWDE
ncbi:MAG: hypothetical protein E7381_02845 [Clostridiales bacterium]|nr:hypothetical protein [Clostridiales bacterium]